VVSNTGLSVEGVSTSPESPNEELTPFPVGLSFADGFQFGCGFMVAVILSLAILALAIFIVVLVLPLLGLNPL